MKQNYSRKLWPVKALAILVKIVRCLSCQRSLSAVIVIILKHFCILIHQNIFYFVALSSWDISCCSTRPFGSKKNMATSLLPLSCYQIASNMLDVL